MPVINTLKCKGYLGANKYIDGAHKYKYASPPKRTSRHIIYKRRKININDLKDISLNTLSKADTRCNSLRKKKGQKNSKENLLINKSGSL